MHETVLSVSSVSETGLSDSPYPGLRPFRRDESDIFFGREEQVDQLLNRLGDCRFLAVVGPSGCGKSSLVRAGMLAALEGGFLSAAGPRWLLAEMRPGSQPFANLARALLESRLLGEDWVNHANASSFLTASFRRGPLGLVELAQEAGLPERTNLLVLVDQFEEIFRFRKHGDPAEATAFVNLLLESAHQDDIPIYIVITMRSDFLGDCAVFAGLPEALNEGQFLTPRLTREQCRATVVGPAAGFGAEVEPELVNRILNDIGTDPDQLPLMQHALMRVWTVTLETAGATGEARGRGLGTASEMAGQILLKASTYEQVGGLLHALSRHADEAYGELGVEEHRLAEVLFRCLSERSEGRRDTRRPIQLQSVAEITGVSTERIAKVVEVFRRPDRSFLTPSAGVALELDTVLDIAHESLIRQWKKLNAWVDAEADSATIYLRLLETARLWRDGRAALWTTPDLENALAWRDRERPSAAWAERYGGEFAQSMQFLDASSETQDEKRHADELRQERELELTRQVAETEKHRADEAERRQQEQARANDRLRRRTRVAFSVGVVAIFLAGLAGYFYKDAHHNYKVANRNYKVAHDYQQRAHDQSETFLSLADQAHKDEDGDPRELALLSKALQRDPFNAKAIERTCRLLLERTWCPPLTPPLGYASDTPILCATFGPQESGKYILAVSEEGRLWGCDSRGAALEQLPKLMERSGKKKFISAFFNDNGRELLLIPPMGDGESSVEGEIWRLGNDNKYEPQEPIKIKGVSPMASAIWSSDGKLLMYVASGFDHQMCQAFRFDGHRYVDISPDELCGSTTVAAIRSTDDLVTTGSSKGKFQLWKWDGNRLEKMQHSPLALDKEARPYFLTFGPKQDEMIVAAREQSSNLAKILNVSPNIAPKELTFKERFVRFVLSPKAATSQMVATALPGRIVLYDIDLGRQISEPIYVQAVTAVPVFSVDGKQMLTISGAFFGAMDTVQVWDTSLKFGRAEFTSKLNNEPAPRWLADLARAVSGIPRTLYEEEQDVPATLSAVLDNPIKQQTQRGPYIEVWQHFFGSSPTSVGN